jgi:uncharacterized protein (TIGR03083 family)
MAKATIWPVVHAERKALAADLAGIGDDRWAVPSLCSQWTVRDVVAHMTATAKISPASFFPRLVGSGFSLTRLQKKDIAANRGSSPSEALGLFESVITSEKGPPGPPETNLGETLVHADDIRRALGIPHDYPTDAVIAVADFYKRSNLIIGGKRRVTGVTLKATDVEWSNGSGPEVSGPLMTLVMAMTGRKQVLDELAGDGVAVLRQRP